MYPYKIYDQMSSRDAHARGEEETAISGSSATDGETRLQGSPSTRAHWWEKLTERVVRFLRGIAGGGLGAMDGNGGWNKKENGKWGKENGK